MTPTGPSTTSLTVKPAGTLHREGRHPALRGTDRHQMPAVDHARSGQKQVGDLGEELGFLGGRIALFRAGLDAHGIHRTQH